MISFPGRDKFREADSFTPTYPVINTVPVILGKGEGESESEGESEGEGEGEGDDNDGESEGGLLT